MITESWTEDRLLDRLFSFHDQTGAGLCTMPLSRNTRGISPTVGKFEFFLNFRSDIPILYFVFQVWRTLSRIVLLYDSIAGLEHGGVTKT